MSTLAISALVTSGQVVSATVSPAAQPARVRFGHGKLRATDRDQQQTVFVTTVRLLGYWRLELPGNDPFYSHRYYRDQMLQWPDATLLVDPNWREDERRRVGEYLQRGTRVNQSRGLSLCRFCERHNGSAELTDGVYCWPEGLAHYVSEHDVRLPQEFVGHALSQPPFPPGLPQPSFDELGQRDRSWPGPSFAPPVGSGGSLLRRVPRNPPLGCPDPGRVRPGGSELVATSHGDTEQRLTALDTPRTRYIT